MTLNKKNDICFKLELLTGLKSHQKIDTSTMVIYNNNLTTSLMRTCKTVFGQRGGNSRDDLYLFIDTTSTDALEFAKLYYSSTNTIDKSMADEVLNYLNNLVSVIDVHLTATYAGDNKFVGQLRFLSNSIKRQINIITTMQNDIPKSIIINNAVSQSTGDKIPNSI